MFPLSRNDINSVLLSKLKCEDFELISCEESKKDVGPIGFLSRQQKACIRYKRGGQDQELHIFIKNLPVSAYHRETVVTSGAFRKEAIVFNKFLNELNAKWEGNPVPTCYLGRDDLVVLNDLSLEGFSNVPLHETYTLDHCEKAFESLAKLHASSLVFEIKNKCKISEYMPILQEETIFTDDNNSTTKRAVLVGLKALRSLKNKYLANYEEDMTEKAFEYMEKLNEKMGPSAKYPNVLSHSDLWTNNLMFRYNSESKVAEACIIDFQLAAYRPLVYDILMLLHVCTDKDLRHKHFDNFLKHYHQHLSNELTSEGIDITELLSWSDFEAMVSENLPVLLALAPQFLHFVLMPDDIVREVLSCEEKWKFYYEVDRAPFALKAAAECIPYRTRVLEALEELIEYFRSHTPQ